MITDIIVAAIIGWLVGILCSACFFAELLKLAVKKSKNHGTDSGSVKGIIPPGWPRCSQLDSPTSRPLGVDKKKESKNVTKES